MPVVDIDSVGTVEFPDSMTQADIASASEQIYRERKPQTPIQPVMGEVKAADASYKSTDQLLDTMDTSAIMPIPKVEIPQPKNFTNSDEKPESFLWKDRPNATIGDRISTALSGAAGDLSKWWKDMNAPLIEATPTGGKFGRFASEDPEAVAEVKRIQSEGTPLEKNAIGVRAGAEEFLSGLTSPISLLTFGAAGILEGAPVLSRMLSGWFAFHTGKTLAVDAAKELGQEYAKPPEQRDQTKLAHLWTGAALSVPLTAALGVHALSPNPSPLVTPRGPTRADHLETLGLGPDATPEDIKTAFRNMAKEVHPDVNPSPDATAKFQEILAAYTALTPPRPNAGAEKPVTPTEPAKPTVTPAEHAAAADVGPATAEALKEVEKVTPPVPAAPAAPVEPAPPKEAPVVYKGFNQGIGRIPGSHQYDVTEDVSPTFKKGMTVSEAQIAKEGLTIPAAEKAKAVEPSESVQESLAKAAKETSDREARYRELTSKLPDGTVISGWTKQTIGGDVMWINGKRGTANVMVEAGHKAVDAALQSTKPTTPAPEAAKDQTAASIIRDRVVAAESVQNALKNTPHNLLQEVTSELDRQMGKFAAEIPTMTGKPAVGKDWADSFNSIRKKDVLAQGITDWMLRKQAGASSPTAPKPELKIPAPESRDIRAATKLEQQRLGVSFRAILSGNEGGFMSVDAFGQTEQEAFEKAQIEWDTKWKKRLEDRKAKESAPKPPTPAPAPTEPRKADNLSGMSESELDALLDEASGEKPPTPAAAPAPAPPAPAPATAPAPAPAPTTKTAGDIAAEAAKLGVQGADEAIQGLHKLFGGGKHTGSGPSFDEKTYQEAKPHFEKAYQNFKAAGKSLGEFLKFIFDQFGANVRAYIKRFVQEKQAEVSVDTAKLKEQGKSNETGNQPRTPGTQPASPDNRVGVGGEQPGTGEGVGEGREPAPTGEGSAGSGERRAGEGAAGPATGNASTGAPRGVRNLRGTSPESVNYVITDADKLGEGGAKTKVQDNFKAIRLVKQLEAENRLPTEEERATLVRYVGWGGLKGAFDPSNKSFAKEFQELRDLLTDEEYKRARASIQDAHYTSQTIIQRGVYAALKRLGFTGGKMVEGGVGIGNFIGLLPESWRKDTSYLGVERDPLTAKIAKYLYPEAKILEMGYQDADLKPGSFDGAVGNPPFGNKSIYDKNFPESSKHSIHNYFIGKTLELLKPNGVAGFVVSRYFLDAVDPTAREHIAKLGEFLGAIRLPNTAFKENVNTEVVTDLVFFRKLPEGITADTGWTKTVSYTDPKSGLSAKMNQWLADHPEMVVGDLSVGKDKMHGGESSIVVNGKPNQDLGADLDKAVENLPKDVYQAVPTETKQRLTTPETIGVPEGVKVGALFVTPSGIAKRTADVNAERQSSPITPAKGAEPRIRGIIPIRDALNDLVQAELSVESSPAEIEAKRATLNKVYDAFVKKHGFLNSQTNRRAFFEDRDNMRVLGLEKDYISGVSEATAKKKGMEPIPPTAKKADIFARRVNAPYQEITRVDTPKEALSVSLNQRGKVDLEHMADLTGMDPKEILNVLEGLVYKTPEGEYESKEQYLSGNVRAKLKAAEAAGPEFAKNVEALKPVIPKDIAPTDIIAPVGAPWVDAKDVSKFAEELTGSAPSAVLYQKANAGWLFTHNDRGVASTEKWGTKEMPFGELFKTMLNGKAVVVYDYVDDGKGGEMRVVNQPETELANAKATEIREKWQDWLWADKARRDRLHRVYNDNFNNYVDFRADGSHLTLPGASVAITLNPHQKNVAWRTITNGNDGLLYDHVVGAGKTFAGVASMMELKRLGRVRKWLVTVPNHLTGQWSDAFSQLYPNANVLAAKASDFSKDNRQKLFSKILTGDYDAVILGHSSLKKVGTSPEVEKQILEEMVKEITDTIQAMKDAEGKKGSRAIAAMEKVKDNLEAKVSRLADISGRDTVASFEELGFDGMLVDEAHEFKNLFYTTQMQNVAGLGNPKGSAKAFDLYLKTRYLRNQFGGKAPIVFATGTPISNSLVEMFTMQRYLQPKVLEDMGLKTLDAWARVFADVRPVYEVDPTGTGYRMATRLANFQNVGELTGIYRNMADVITMNDLQTQAESAGKRFPVPKVKGGKPQNLVAERTPEQASYFGIETQEIDSEGKPVFDAEGNPVTSYPPGTILWRVDNMPDDPREDNMLKLTNDARKAGLDMRLINPSMPDRPESKINKAVSEISRIYKKTDADKGTQLVFCDLSVPASARGSATKKAKTGGIGFYIKSGQGLKAVEGKAVTIPGYEDFRFFVHKGPNGWTVSEATTGLSTGNAKSTREAAITAAAETMANRTSKEKFIAVISANQPTSEQLTELKAQVEEAAKPEEPVEDDAQEASEEGVSVDELLADQSSFSVYDDMKAKLIKAGVPEKEIAFIHDYDSPEKKMKLFKQVNAGEVRILFGSTPKLGAGTNVQKKIVALHHMDAPWRPSDLEQREGRAIRQGNEFYDEAIKNPAYKKPQDYDTDPDAFALEINRYATALTYDTRMWQLIEHKAAGIEGFRKADRNTRTIEDVGGEAANASDMKAAASGDPLIQQELQLRNEATKLALLKKAWTNNRIDLQNREAFLRDYDLRYQSRVDELNRVKDTLDKNSPVDKDGKPVFEFTLPDGTKTDEKGTALNVAVEAIKEGKRGYLGKYRGFDFSFEPTQRTGTVYVTDANGQEHPTQRTIKGVNFYIGKQDYDYSKRVTGYEGDDKLTGVGLFQRFDNYFAGHEEKMEQSKLRRDSDEKTLGELRAELAKKFTKDEALTKAQKEHAEVRTQLMNKKRSKMAPAPKPEAPKPAAAKACGAGM